MEKQVQYFQIANLIFSSSYNETVTMSGKDMAEIQTRFQQLVKSFEASNNTQYTTNFIKQGGNNLPYNSMVAFGMIKDHLLLHFTYSYREPVMLIINTKDNMLRNFINIEKAKDILDDDIYNDVKEALSFPKKLDRIFKGISDINSFIEKYEEILQSYNNLETVTGRECFEINLDDIER